MKNLSILFLGLVMTLSVAGTVYSVANENSNGSAICMIAFAASALAMPSAKATGVLGFLNKSYFSQTDKPFTRTELALLEYLNTNGKVQTVAAVQSGQIKLETYIRGFRFVIPNNTTGRLTLLDTSKQYLQGAIPEEFNTGVLPDGYNIAVSHVRVGFVADAVIMTGQAGVAYGSQPNAWVAALRNGQLLFSEAGAIKQFVDVIGTGTMAAGFGSIGENDGLELQAPFIIEESKANKWELITASGQSFGAPAGGNLLEVILYGSMIRYRS